MAWGQTFTGVRLEQGDPGRPGMGQAGHHTTNGLNHWTVKEGGVKGNKDPKEVLAQRVLWSEGRVKIQNKLKIWKHFRLKVRDKVGWKF